MQSPDDKKDPIAEQTEEAVSDTAAQDSADSLIGPAGDTSEAPVGPGHAAEEEEEEALPEAAAFTPENKKQDIHAERPVMKPLASGQNPELGECIAILRETAGILNQVLTNQGVLFERMIENETALAEEIGKRSDRIPDHMGNAHLRTILGGLANAVNATEDQHEATLNREGARWRQTIEVDGKKIGGGVPVQRLAKDGKYSREELKSYVTRRAGVGGNVDMPLWHSGIWLRFNAPSLIALTAMNQEIANVKVSVGSATRGLAFSNISHFMKSIVVDFALQHVIHANVAYNTPTDLKELIDTRDIPAVILGLVGTLYPGGYPYATACVADLNKCNHITKELLQVANLWWVDDNSLTPWQRQHMAFRIDARVPRTRDDIQAYKDQHIRGRERLVWIGEMGFLLSCPNVYDHEELGNAWLNGIIDMTQGAFNEPPEGRNRGAYINQLAEATSAREYAHWVKAVVDRDDESAEGYVILSEEKDFIAEILSDVYSADEQIDPFKEAVTKYIDDSIIAITGITSFNCPSCNTPNAVEFKKRFENIVPVDPLAEFFRLASRKLSRIV